VHCQASILTASKRRVLLPAEDKKCIHNNDEEICLKAVNFEVEGDEDNIKIDLRDQFVVMRVWRTASGLYTVADFNIRIH
jgi:hypothetical protein